MKTTEFIEKVETLGYEAIKQNVTNENHESVSLIFVCKDEENTIHVGESEKWILKNDYYKFAFLTDAEKDALMALAVEYIATDPEDRI